MRLRFRYRAFDEQRCVFRLPLLTLGCDYAVSALMRATRAREARWALGGFDDDF